MDNLEAQTYETFEKDSVKYIQVSQICFQDSYFHHLWIIQDSYLTILR